MKYTLNLQLFADGGASAGASSTAGATTGDNSAGSPPVGQTTAEPKVVYGKQNKPSESDTQAQQKQQLSFKELMKSKEYAEEANEYFQKTMSKRLKRYEGVEEENEKMRNILNMSNMRYGLDPSSATYLDDLANRVQSDTKLFEDEAAAQGMNVEQYLRVKQAEQIINQNQQFEANRQKNETVQKHLQNMITQSDELKKDFPNFDIETELKNERFRRLVDPPELGGANVSVRDAFFAIHHNEIMKQTMNNAVNQAQIQTANAISANKSRPSENGLSKNATVVVKDDPSKLKLEDFRRIREEYRRTGYQPRFD